MSKNAGNLFKFFLMIILSLSLFAHSEEEIKSKISSLKGEIKSNEKQITKLESENQKLDKQVNDLESELADLKYKNRPNNTYICVIPTLIYSSPGSKNNYGRFSKDDEINAIGETNTHYKIKFEDKIAYVIKNAFASPNEYSKKVNEFDKKKSQWKSDSEENKKENERLNKLIKKYGKVDGTKVYNRKIWIGMTSQMTRDSIGHPSDINKSVYSWGVKEQWVYSKGRYKYLYFDDGILTSWQE